MLFLQFLPATRISSSQLESHGGLSPAATSKLRFSGKHSFPIFRIPVVSLKDCSLSQQLALATKRLVLERMPLFLHERSKAALSTDALRRQLDVVEVKSLSLKRILSIGGINHSSSEPASAAVFKERGRIRLVVSGAFDVDYYGSFSISSSPIPSIN